MRFNVLIRRLNNLSVCVYHRLSLYILPMHLASNSVLARRIPVPFKNQTVHLAFRCHNWNLRAARNRWLEALKEIGNRPHQTLSLAYRYLLNALIRGEVHSATRHSTIGAPDLRPNWFRSGLQTLPTESFESLGEPRDTEHLSQRIDTFEPCCGVYCFLLSRRELN